MDILTAGIPAGCFMYINIYYIQEAPPRGGREPLFFSIKSISALHRPNILKKRFVEAEIFLAARDHPACFLLRDIKLNRYLFV